METLLVLYRTYREKAMAWYDGLTFLEQFGVLFAIVLVGAGIVIYLFNRRRS
jgi:hypothetical protein